MSAIRMDEDRTIDLNQLRPMDEEEEDEESSRQLLVMGFTFPELLGMINAAFGFSLAFMSLFGRSSGRYGGVSFVQSCVTEFQQAAFQSEQESPIYAVSFVSYVLERFFSEATSTVGGSLITDSVFTLHAAVVLSVILESNRRCVVAADFGAKSRIFAALFPVACLTVGVSVVYPLFLAWIWQARRNGVALEPPGNEKRLDILPMYDVDLKRSVLACASALSIIALQFGLLGSGTREIGYKFSPHHVVLFLLAPALPALGTLLLSPSSSATSSSKQARMKSGALSVVSFLIIGAAGFAVHTSGFARFESTMKAEGGQTAMDSVVKDALSSAPSRFLFVQFIHVQLACVLFCAREMSGTGGAGLILFVTALVGPAGAFALLAAHHEFRLMREDNLM